MEKQKLTQEQVNEGLSRFELALKQASEAKVASAPTASHAPGFVPATEGQITRFKNAF